MYRFCYRTPEGSPAAGHFYEVNDAAAYADYAHVCRLVVQMPLFQPVYHVVSQQFQRLPAYADRPVKPMRALKFVMFSTRGATAERFTKRHASNQSL